MKQSAFKSLFTLSFKFKFLDDLYGKRMEKSYLSIAISFISLCLSIGLSLGEPWKRWTSEYNNKKLLFNTDFSDEDKINNINVGFEVVNYINSTGGFILFGFALLQQFVKSLQKPNIFKFFILLNYFLLGLCLISIRLITGLTATLHDRPTSHYALSYLGVISMVFWIIYFQNHYLHILFVNLLLFAYSIVLDRICFDLIYLSDDLIYLAVLIILSIFSYAIEYMMKNIYFYKYFYEKKYNEYYSILNNLKSGYIRFQIDNNVIYSNNTIDKEFNFILIKNLRRANAMINEDILITSSSGKDILKQEYATKRLITSLFSSMEKTNELLDLTANDINNETLLGKKEYFTNFTYLGIKMFELGELEDDGSQKIVYVEFYLKISKVDFDNTKLEEEFTFELLLNNITKIVLDQKLETEVQVKSMFLSKAGHELKNPSISIGYLCKELINSLVVDFERLPKMVKQTIKTIEQLSFYINFLVTDFEYLGKYLTREDILIEKESILLKEELTLFKEFALTLINRSSNVNVDVILTNKINPKVSIYSDRYRFQQILFNLISNSTKFTLSGKIEIKADYYFNCNSSLEKNNSSNGILITISDTGPGINKKFESKLFNSIFKENSIENFYGYGMGLVLAKDISEKLGLILEYESNLPNGSIFMLKIPEISLNKKNYKYNCSSIEEFSCLESSISKTILLDDNCNSLDLDYLRKNKPSITKIENKLEICYLDFYIINQVYDKFIFKYKDLIKNEYNDIDYIGIIVDDEIILRKSIINSLSKSYNSCSVKNNIRLYELEDGFECIFLLYYLKIKGLTPKFIITDETMRYMSGSTCLSFVNSLYSNLQIKLFVLSAYLQQELKSKYASVTIDKFFNKPLKVKDIEYIYSALND